MTDLRSTLNRLGDELPDPRGLDALDRRRRRRRRRDRLLAGAIGLLVAAVGTTSAYLAFGAGKDQPRPDHPAAQEAPNVARITCDGETATVQTPTVQVQPDGVHLEVTNTASFEVWIVTQGADSDASPIVPAGQTESSVTEGLHAGTSNVWCGPSREDVNDGPSEDSLTIVDPDGIWKSTGLSCPPGEGAVNGIFDFFREAKGQSGTPIEIVRRKYEGVLGPDDVVDYGGYPEGHAYGAIVRVSRQGATLGTFSFIPGLGDTWLQNEYSACNSFNEDLNRA
jgi:hypothetical protein